MGPKILLSCLILTTTLTQVSAKTIIDFAPNKIESFKKSKIKNVDNAVCINLKIRPEKWERISTDFKKYGVNLQRFDAINGWEIKDIQKIRSSACFKQSNYYLNPGEIGAYLSHLTIWKNAHEKKLSAIWVLEDDANIVKDPHKITEFIKNLESVDPNWDILFTESNFWNNCALIPLEKRRKFIHRISGQLMKSTVRYRRYPKIEDFSIYDHQIVVNKHLKRIFGRWGLHSYIVSNRGLKKLVDYFSKVKIVLPVDTEINIVPDIRLYTTTSDIVGQNFKTKISDTRKRP